MNGKTVDCAVLGATGLVGQEFLRLLARHPWFRIRLLAGSQASHGLPLGVRLPGLDLPAELLDRRLVDLEEVLADPPPLVFSALPAGEAGEVETRLAARGCHVFSNAASHRGDPDVPILVPEVNPHHLEALPVQRRARRSSGSLVTNPNCSTAGLVLGLGPWLARFAARSLHVASYQALSGAGLPGLPALAIHANVIPHIAGEEAKIERETAKILGKWDGSGFQAWPGLVFASTARVPVAHGHLLAVHAELGEPVHLDALRDACERWRPAYGALELPSAPRRAVVWDDRPDAPQPARDLDPMSVRIGRVRHDRGVTRAFLLSHNLIRGSAGGSLLNAELAWATGWLS